MSWRTKAVSILMAATALGLCCPGWAQAPPPTISTVAGTGRYGYSGDNGPASSARIDAVYALCIDSRGNVLLADSWNHRIRKIAPEGVITTVAGTGEAGFSGDGGPATSAKLSYPRGVAADAQGNIYISDSGNYRVRKVGANGAISTIAGGWTRGYAGDGGPASSAQLDVPRGVAVDAAGNLFIADGWNFRIRRITPQGTISTVAGTGASGQSGDGGPATAAAIGLVQGLATDARGNLYFTDVYNHSVRKIAANGTISTIAGASDGAAAKAPLRFPRGIAVDLYGRIWVADSENHRLRMLLPDGAITTWAGTGTAAYSGDGGEATAAALNFPYAVAADASGSVLIADVRNYRIRKVQGGPVVTRPALDAAKSVVNGASFTRPVAAGSLVTFYGTKLASGEHLASTVPLPTVLGELTATVDGQPIPLLYVSATQVNAQLPASLTPGRHTLRVSAGPVDSDPLDFNVVASAPGIFLWPGNQGVVLNQDGTANGPDSRAERNTVIVIWGTGAGEVRPPIREGTPAGSSPLSLTAAQPAVLIGGRPSPQVLFSGLAPGWIGLWQINAYVPPDAPIGDSVPLEIVLAGAGSNVVNVGVR